MVIQQNWNCKYSLKVIVLLMVVSGLVYSQSQPTLRAPNDSSVVQVYSGFVVADNVTTPFIVHFTFWTPDGDPATGVLSRTARDESGGLIPSHIDTLQTLYSGRFYDQNGNVYLNSLGQPLLWENQPASWLASFSSNPNNVIYPSPGGKVLLDLSAEAAWQGGHPDSGIYGVVLDITTELKCSPDTISEMLSRYPQEFRRILATNEAFASGPTETEKLYQKGKPGSLTRSRKPKARKTPRKKVSIKSDNTTGARLPASKIHRTRQPERKPQVRQLKR